jgi:uncharacterized protein (DUF2267 family)
MTVATDIKQQDRPFLEKVQAEAELPDIYDARDITVVIFRTMRDLMSTETSEQVASELRTDRAASDNPAIREDVADLWQDTNPLVSFLSKVRPPLSFDADAFLRRIKQEGALPANVMPQQAISAVFKATKVELSVEQNQQVQAVLPGAIKSFWEQA